MQEVARTKDVADGSEGQGAAVTEAAESSAEHQLTEATPDPSKDICPPQEGDSLGGQSVSLAKETPEGLTEEVTCDKGPLAQISPSHETQTDTEAQESTATKPSGEAEASPLSEAAVKAGSGTGLGEVSSALQ